MSEYKVEKLVSYVKKLNNVIYGEYEHMLKIISDSNYQIDNYLYDKSYKKNFTCNTLLSVIFNYDELNNYAKKVFDNVNFTIEFNRYKEFGRSDVFSNNSLVPKGYDVEKRKYSSSFGVEKIIIEIENIKDSEKKLAYEVIFWSLFILALDNKNESEKISNICDIAALGNVSDNELKDLCYLVKKAFRDAPKDYTMSTKVKGEMIKLIDIL